MRRSSVPIWAAIALCALRLSPVHAGTLPAYDSETICTDLAGTSVKQDVVMRGCLDFQERTRKEIALSWNRIPEPVQNSCSKAAEASGDYWRLKSCIDQAAAKTTER